MQYFIIYLCYYALFQGFVRAIYAFYRLSYKNCSFPSGLSYISFTFILSIPLKVSNTEINFKEDRSTLHNAINDKLKIA